MNSTLNNLNNNSCTKCFLCRERTNIVIGRGTDARVRTLIIGEAPGAEEDETGEPFKGQSGKLLDDAIHPYMDSIYITNLVKCRPPNNRNPTAIEIATCKPYLEQQIVDMEPERVIILGRVPFTAMFPNISGTRMLDWIENGPYTYKDLRGRSIPVHVRYHPAYILRNRSKTDAWKANLRELMES